jgi:hypothetical protein
MRWSKLKQRIEDGFAQSVRGRVEIWTTRYRHAHDQEGEAWITIDGQRLHSMGSMTYFIEEWKMQGRPDYRAGERRARPLHEVKDALHAKGAMGLWSVNSALFDYLSMSIEDVLSSDVALVRGIGMLDRRLGKRRLGAIDTSLSPLFVNELYRFRCDCEDVAPFVGPNVDQTAPAP